MTEQLPPWAVRAQRAADALGAHFARRFALCPLLGAPDVRRVRAALEAGRVPVVVSDSMQLPHAERIDYSRLLFQIGTCASELELLPALCQLPAPAIQKMVRAGRSVSLCGAPLLSDVRTPSHRRDGHLLRECEWLRSMWRRLAGRVLIWGAGKYLRRLMRESFGLVQGPQIVGIVDDFATGSARVGAIPIVLPRAVSRSDFDSIFLATDSLEERFARRAREQFGADVHLLRPSELMAHFDTDQVAADEALGEVVGPLPSARFPVALEAVVVCVGYADFLSWSLPNNLPQLDRVVVVTSPEDLKTQRVAAACGAEVVLSDRFRERGATFNKGKMINEGLDRLAPTGWVLVSDADVLFRPGLRRRLFQRLLNERSLYYVSRFDTPRAGRAAWLHRYWKHPELFRELQFEDLGSNQMPWGYFQLFYARPGLRYSEGFDSAGEVDYEFQNRWPASHRVLLPEAVVHIAHGARGQNWSGRISAPLSLNELQVV